MRLILVVVLAVVAVLGLSSLPSVTAGHAALPGEELEENDHIAECAAQRTCEDAVMSGLCVWSISAHRAFPSWAHHSGSLADDHFFATTLDECAEHVH